VKLFCTNLIRVSAAFLIAAIISPSLFAQEPQFDDLAKDMTHVLVKSKQHKVVVVDFFAADAYQTGDEMNDVGRKLADDFRAALLRRNHDIEVEDRAKMMDRLRKHDLIIENLRSPATVTWLLGDSHVDAWVSGDLSKDAEGLLKVRVQAYQVDKSFSEYEGETSIPITPELNALIGKKPPSEFPSMAIAGENGVTNPACLYCPAAQYTAEAARAKIQGEVELAITIDETGKAQDIRVNVGLPGGLTDQAVQAVKTWRFKPAVDAKGNPVAVREPLEVMFRLY
jgi:TonB family protein